MDSGTNQGSPRGEEEELWLDREACGGTSYKLASLRHGENEWNVQNLFTGWADVPLSDEGRDV